MSEKSDLERSILARAYANPDTTPAEIAASLDCSESYVGEVLEEYADGGTVDAIAETDWDDPGRCPFCGERLADPGPGFVDHLDGSPECAVEFEAWREGIAGDVGGEWIG